LFAILIILVLASSGGMVVVKVGMMAENVRDVCVVISFYDDRVVTVSDLREPRTSKIVHWTGTWS